MRNSEKVRESLEELRDMGCPLLVLILIVLICLGLAVVIGIGFWTLIAAIPIAVGALIFPYSFSWTYALFGGVCIWVLRCIFGGKSE